MNYKLEIAKNISKITNINADEIVNYIEIPPNSDMGDYAFPCFRLAKELKKAPVQIAQDIKDKYEIDDIIQKIDVVNGYLNFYTNKAKFVENIMKEVNEKGQQYGTSNIGQGKTVVIDYSAPNIAKPFHIGHLRTTVIGGALYKIYKFMGYNVVGINYLGDWGIQFGKVMAGIALWGNEYDLSNNETAINSILQIYVRFNKEEKENPDLTDLARQWFKKLESGDNEAVEKWKWIRKLSLDNYQKTYDLLNSKFDSYNGEAYYEDKMDVVIEELEKKGLLKESQGAKVVDLEEYNMPPCIIITSNGTTIYATRDLAAFIDRIKTYDFDKIIYVVGGEQKLHFCQIFKVLELMGYEKYVQRAEHVPFGLVVDKDGEKIGSRKGNSVSLEDILNQSIDKVKNIISEKNPDLDEKQKEDIAKKVGVGAIIFNDLSNSRIKDEIFDWDMLLNFNGETGPYVQFMYVRTKSILEKSNIDINNIEDFKFELLKEKEELDIVKIISNFEESILNAMNKNEPSILTRYIIDLASAYSSFYAKHIVISDDIELTKVRLLLTKQVGDIIKKGMSLLGIDCPEKM